MLYNAFYSDIYFSSKVTTGLSSPFPTPPVIRFWQFDPSKKDKSTTFAVKHQVGSVNTPSDSVVIFRIHQNELTLRALQALPSVLGIQPCSPKFLCSVYQLYGDFRLLNVDALVCMHRCQKQAKIGWKWPPHFLHLHHVMFEGRWEESCKVKGHCCHLLVLIKVPLPSSNAF